MLPVTLYVAIFATCLALNHGAPLNGGVDTLNVNFGDFPPPVPNAPDLQQAGLYQNSNALRSDGSLSGALANQNMIMEPSGGVEFGRSFGVNQNTGLGRQTGFGMRSGLSQNPSLGVNSGLSQNPSLGVNSGLSQNPSLGVNSGLSQNPSLGVNSGLGGLGPLDGSVGSLGMGPMDAANSGFGNPSGSFGEIPSGVLDQGFDLSNTASQTVGGGGMPSTGRSQNQRNVYMTGSPVVPGARGITRNVSRRPMPILRPPPVILLPPRQRRPFSLFGRRNPGVMPLSLVPLGPPMSIPYSPRQL